jgi:hypothetical protein
MNELYLKYFANVRWTELALAIGVATLGKLQLTVQGGGKLDQHAVIEAATVGLSVGWAYLRMPKGQADAPSVQVDDLPPGVDATGPAHDVPAEVATAAVESVLGPVGAAAPELAGNIVNELRRVLKRGIKW